MASKSYDTYIDVSDKGTKKVLGSFEELLPELEGKKILDVGCGTGLLLKKYAKKNEATGIDNNNASLAIAKQKGIRTLNHNLEKKLSFNSNYFDLVICKDVLEFIYNADQLLDEMVRITKKGGTLLLHVPNELNAFDLVSIALGKGILKKRWYASSSELSNPHIRFFTSNELKKILESKGFSVEDHSSKWAFTIPLIGVKAGFLSSISPRLFSPGITLMCKK